MLIIRSLSQSDVLSYVSVKAKRNVFHFPFEFGPCLSLIVLVSDRLLVR